MSNSDIGQFGIIPAWFIKAKPKQRAIHLFAIITAYYANREGEAWPSRERLAEDMEVSVDTVDKAMRELVAIGIVTKHPRRREDGGQSSNLLQITYAQPYEIRGGGRTEQPPLAVTVRPRTRSIDPDPVEPDPVNHVNKISHGKNDDFLDEELLRDFALKYDAVDVELQKEMFLSQWEKHLHKKWSNQRLAFHTWCANQQRWTEPKGRQKQPVTLSDRKRKYLGE